MTKFLLAGVCLSAATAFPVQVQAGSIDCRGGEDGVVYKVLATTDSAGSVGTMSFSYEDNDGFAFGRDLTGTNTNNALGRRLDFTGHDEGGDVRVLAPYADGHYRGTVTASGSVGESLEIDVVCRVD